MLFNSWQFGLFFIIVFALYFAMPHKYRWILLLIASYYFYMSWNPELIVLIGFTTITSFVSAILIERTETKAKKKFFLYLSLISSLGVLFVFKYFNFFSETITEILHYYSLNVNSISLKLLLPVGISFYTFQTLSYTIDVYRGKIKATYHLGIFAVFVSFFPQLVAGPIERASNLLPQFYEKHEFNYDMAVSGTRIMLWGFFKKLLIADAIAPLVNIVYNSPHIFGGGPLIIATLLFTIQIYCDFSGYSDIAIGAARVLGFRLMKNFDSPYFSSSIKEFWKRWHISLSTWFMDYVYIPLGGSRCKEFRTCINLFITFFISGLWHGANLTFVAWGAIHGAYLIIERLARNCIKYLKLPKIHERYYFLIKTVKIMTTFVFVSFAWIFFRANNISDAIYIVGSCFNNMTWSLHELSMSIAIVFKNSFTFYSICIFIGILIVHDFLNLRFDVLEKLGELPVWFSWIVYLIITIAILLFYNYGSVAEFIYFQF